jgi:GNAT superfamily N-acetyltransferase
MTVADIAAGMRLRELAGWNQIEQDWRRFLQLEPAGCFVTCLAERVCGTVTTLSYEKCFGWVSMVLVDPEHRRQGIGTRLLEAGIAYLDEAGVETVKLDATPMGRLVYVQRGFVDEYEIERWEGVSGIDASAGLPVMTRNDLERVCIWDREVFGADRRRLLTCLWQENARYSAVVYSGAEVAGYVLGRRGAQAHYLGPWVAAPESGVAAQLLREFLSRVRGERVFIDVCLENPEARALAQEAGFQFQRPLMRMYRGPNRYPGQPQLVCGIAGPELG